MLACFTMIVASRQDSFSQTQNHAFLEFQRIKAFQTLHWRVKILGFLLEVFQDSRKPVKSSIVDYFTNCSKT